MQDTQHSSQTATDIPVEAHPLAFFLPEGAKLLLLGSFPPPRARWSMEFYYPNLQNDMWRVMGLAFYGDKGHFMDGKRFDRERIMAFCVEKGIALGDTAVRVRRLGGNASDNLLEVVEAIDLEATLRAIPHCRHIAVTGQKAAETLIGVLAGSGVGIALPKVGEKVEFGFGGRGITLWRMPSTSRAYPAPLEGKAEIYKKMMRLAGLAEK